MHVPMQEFYPVLTLIQSLASMTRVRQGETESFLNYLERFKLERNVMRSLFGSSLLDAFIKNNLDYKNIPLGTDMASQ